MHDEVISELEDILAGRTSGAASAHLSACAECRLEVDEIRNASAMMAELRADDVPEPAPFFYNRVARTIIERESSGMWGILKPGAAFYRKVVFASLLVLAAMSTWLVRREADSTGADAAAIMAQHDATADHSDAADRDMILATLASYR